MKVSIITACYNSSKTIRETYLSVKNQTYSNIEHLFIDGQSTDETLEILNNYSNQKNIKIISKSDSGIYDALNNGLKSATGDIIGFVHSDDMLASSSIIYEIILKFKEKNLDGVYGDLEYVSKDNSKVLRIWKSNNFSQKLLKKGWMPAHPTFFIKKDVYNKHGLFNLKYKISSDYDFMTRILKDDNLNFGYLPKVITKMRIGGASNKSLKNILIKMSEDCDIVYSHSTGNWFTILLKNMQKLKQLRYRI